MGCEARDVVIAGWAKILKCGIDTTPFVFLGLPIGAKPSENRLWKNVLDRVEKCLKSGRITFFPLGEESL